MKLIKKIPAPKFTYFLSGFGGLFASEMGTSIVFICGTISGKSSASWLWAWFGVEGLFCELPK